MTDPNIRTLRDIIAGIEAERWSDALYIRQRPPWTVDTLGAVLNPDDSEEDEEAPAFARQHELSYALPIATVQDIVQNARSQLSAPNITDLIEAINYYYGHDAFIDFGGTRSG